MSSHSPAPVSETHSVVEDSEKDSLEKVHEVCRQKKLLITMLGLGVENAKCVVLSISLNQQEKNKRLASTIQTSGQSKVNNT